jgi:hypothetical protein
VQLAIRRSTRLAGDDNVTSSRVLAVRRKSEPHPAPLQQSIICRSLTAPPASGAGGKISLARCQQSTLPQPPVRQVQLRLKPLQSCVGRNVEPHKIAAADRVPSRNHAPFGRAEQNRSLDELRHPVWFPSFLGERRAGGWILVAHLDSVSVTIFQGPGSNLNI